MQGSLCRAQKTGTVTPELPGLNRPFHKEKVNIAQGKSCMIPTVYKGGRGRVRERTDFPGEEMQ